jgi:hypothetical protein
LDAIPETRRDLDSGATWCVVPLAEQDRIEKEIQAGKPLRGTSIKDCK